ncbi:MAG TPA: heme-binding beta-barrel domain-containing protein, partial [Acidimicrobiales bacterium]
GTIERADDALSVVMTSTVVAGTTSAKSVTATRRRYRVSGDTLTYDLDMAAVGHPLLPHLHGTLTRHGL